MLPSFLYSFTSFNLITSHPLKESFKATHLERNKRDGSLFLLDRNNGEHGHCWCSCWNSSV